MRHRVIGVRLHHLARHDAHRNVRSDIEEGVIGPLEAKPNRVAIERLQAGDGTAVVELPAALRGRRDLVQSLDLVRQKQRPRRANLRIEEPLV